MDVNQNNSQINTFVGGMNSDTSVDQVQNNQYLFGLNVRISNNTLILEEPTSNTKENIVCPIKNGKKINFSLNDDIQKNFIKVLAAESIEDLGVLILLDDQYHWNVIRIQTTPIKDLFDIKNIFTSQKEIRTIPRFSVVLTEEIKNIVKLYIANGTDELMQMFVKNDLSDKDYTAKINDSVVNKYFTEVNGNPLYVKEDFLKSNYIFPTDKLIISDKISGCLPTAQVQYTYRFYKHCGITSKLAPLTNKIHTINDSKHSETGCAESTNTNIGFLLNIPCNPGIATIFDRLQVYRLDYIKPHQNAEITLIYDGELIYKEGDKITISDTGYSNISSLTIEEFSSISGQDIIPKTIESNQGYLFASNITDKSSIWLDINDYNPRSYQFDKNGYCILYKDNDTTYLDSPYKKTQYPTWEDVSKYTHNKISDVNYKGKLTDGCFLRKDGILGGTGPNISWKFITMDVTIHQDVENVRKPDVSKDQQLKNKTVFRQYRYKNGKIISEKITDYNADDYIDEKSVYNNGTFDYNNIIGSSICRSLQRNEVYRYGIVFYDERGVRTDVLWIADIRTPDIQDIPNTEYFDKDGNKMLNSVSLGIQFSVKMPIHPDGYHSFVGYEIVRCEKNYTTTHNILQCALSRPINQYLPEKDNYTAYCPYYPTGLITTSRLYFKPTQYGESTQYCPAQTFASNFGNNTLFQIFNPEIQFKRQDILQLLQNVDLDIQLIHRSYGNDISKDSYDLVWGNTSTQIAHNDAYNFITHGSTIDLLHNFQINRRELHKDGSYALSYKSNKTTVFNLYNVKYFDQFEYQPGEINYSSSVLDIQDVKNPTWEEGFTNVKFNSDGKVSNAVSAYKSFITSIQNEVYMNWACCGMYDITTGVEDKHGIYNNLENWLMYINSGDDSESGTDIVHGRNCYSHGYIGPGPVCFVLKTKKDLAVNVEMDCDHMYSYICNLQHEATQFAGLTEQEKQYDLYYGFGNFIKFDKATTESHIFDGDIYNLPCEFVSLFKTYDFNCLTDALPSTQIVYYIPLESKINTFFDYGMNYKNTTNPNLQLEPGRIEGVSSQTRPLHQINLIYSDNANSNNMFNPQTLKKNVEQFQQRIVYSQLKTNGELIDNWHTFKAIDFIDVDSRYGQITNLLSVNDILYFWQEQAFGKLSVNERSLVTDTNNNIVQLGQSGVLQRSDYLDTHHGLREYDYSAINIGHNIYWIDVLNKCIVSFTQNGVINYSEHKNVQNIMNTYCIDEHTYIPNEEIIRHLPTINYDIQNDELICDYMYGSVSPLDEKYRMQLIFNTKLDVATSLYNRKYNDIIQINNKLYGVLLNGEESIRITKYNHLDKKDIDLSYPTVLHFVVNQSPSTTKVFDNQKIVTLKKEYDSKEIQQFFNNKIIYFETDLNSSMKKNLSQDLIQNDESYYQITNRESNLQYPIPRETNNSSNNPISDYGKRLRGKWMQVYMYDKTPKLDYSISHIITKFRQSFS